LKGLVGQGRNQTADAGLFRAAYRIAEVRARALHTRVTEAIFRLLREVD